MLSFPKLCFYVLSNFLGGQALERQGVEADVHRHNLFPGSSRGDGAVSACLTLTRMRKANTARELCNPPACCRDATWCEIKEAWANWLARAARRSRRRSGKQSVRSHRPRWSCLPRWAWWVWSSKWTLANPYPSIASWPVWCSRSRYGRLATRRGIPTGTSRAKSPCGMLEKGDRHHFPEQPGVYAPQMVPVPLFPCPDRARSFRMPWRRSSGRPCGCPGSGERSGAIE